MAKKHVRKNCLRQRLLVHGSAIFALVLLAALVYLPGLSGPFVLDDGENITLNKSVAIQELNANEIAGATYANNSGPFGRPLASLSFALNAYFAGGVDDPRPFKLTNVIIHAINAILIYLLTLKLLATPWLQKRVPHSRAPLLAAVVALIWAVHPLQLTSVLYVVQRMTALSTLFMLCGVIGYLYGRNRYDKGDGQGIWIATGSIVLGTVAGAAAKENAVLLPLLAAVIEFTLMSRRALTVNQRKLLFGFYGLTVGLPILAGALYLLWNPTFLTEGYLGRDFTMWERLLTQGRVLWFYVFLTAVPSPLHFGLFHDDIAISTSLFHPPTTVIAIVLWIGLAVLALTRAKKYPLPAFAVLWFLACHVLESTIVGLEIAYEHRNYLASFGLLFGATITVASMFDKHTVHRAIRYLAVCVALFTLGFSTWSRAHTWSNAETLSTSEARNHPLSPRAQDFAARTALQTKMDLVAAINYTLAGLRLKPSEAGIHIDLQLLLATLSAELKDQMKSAPLSKERREVALEGLSDEVKITYQSGKLQFQVASSQIDHIDPLLESSPVTVHTIFSMENLRRCVLTPPRTCRHLEADALQWHLTAAQNSRVTAENRAVLFHNIALLYAHIGDYQQALRYIERASQTAPKRLAYRLGQVEYMVHAGQADQARELFETILRNTPAHELYANRAALSQLEAMTKRANRKI